MLLHENPVSVADFNHLGQLDFCGKFVGDTDRGVEGPDVSRFHHPCAALDHDEGRLGQPVFVAELLDGIQGVIELLLRVGTSALFFGPDLENDFLLQLLRLTPAKFVQIKNTIQYFVNIGLSMDVDAGIYVQDLKPGSKVGFIRRLGRFHGASQTQAGIFLFWVLPRAPMVACKQHFALFIAIHDVAGKFGAGPVIDIAAAEFLGVDLPSAGNKKNRYFIFVCQLDRSIDTVDAHRADAQQRAAPFLQKRCQSLMNHRVHSPDNLATVSGNSCGS